MREVSEETGISNMTIIKKLIVTRHTYRSNVGKRIIKKSHWYLIETTKQPLKPQTSEDIEKAVWMTLHSDFLARNDKYIPISWKWYIHKTHKSWSAESKSKYRSDEVAKNKKLVYRIL
ncbi:MAG: NUDIX domain-containing protein [Saprospiraceae bacterium]